MKRRLTMTRATKERSLKSIDVIAYALLLIGALNWGLVGFFGFNLVAYLFGEMSALSRVVYALVGLAALYDIVSVKSIWHRWHIRYHEPVTA